MQINKKTLIIVSSILVVLIGLLALYFFVIKPRQSYPKEPILQTSLGTTKQYIEVKKFTAKSGDYPVLGVSNRVQLEKVKEMMTTLNLNIPLKSSEEGGYYNWSDDKNSFFYDLDQNALIFKLSDGIVLNEAEITGYTFTNLLNKYFGLNWNYNVFAKEKRTTGETVYYAKRYITEKNLLEQRDNNGYTDYIAYKDGKITYGKLLLTEFTDANVSAPLITENELKRYLNVKDYPKELYPSYAVLQDSVLKEVNYLSSDFEKITKTMTNCSGTATDVIYLYKSLNQKYLTPVYKMDLQCEIVYDSKTYQIPTTGYVNAIDPNYVNVPE